MTLVDRFVCRREGHVPMFEIKRTRGVTVTSYITKCLRCGRYYTVQPSAENGGKPREERGY